MIEIDAKVVVFDLDDTLYLEKHFAESGFNSLAREFGDRIGGAYFASACAELLTQGTRGNIFDLALSRCGVDATPELIDELVARYRAHRPEIDFCDDACRLLDRIENMPIGLITDGPEQTQWAKIRALGLDQKIDHIVVTGAWGRDFFKPHPRAFQTIEALSSLSGRDLAYIADNAAKDFVTPRRRGWQTVQILRPGRIHPGDASTPDHRADHLISTLDDLQITDVGRSVV